MFRSKRFRAVLCAILAILLFIHTTPLYAAPKATGSSSKAKAAKTTSKQSQSSARATAASGDDLTPPSPDRTTSPQGPTTYLYSGAATYSIPIAVPKGRGDIAPNLSLTYNSFQSNGWVGVGWDLDMGSIQRGTKHGLNYNQNSTDFVAVVQGSNSELVPRPDWGPNCFGNRIEGAFLRYRHNTSSGGWEVTDKSGITYYYGSTTASRIDTQNGTFRWYLDKVRDTFGNYMTVSYAADPVNGALYLQRVDYTGNDGGQSLAPTNSVIFDLDNGSRIDAPVSYASGRMVKTAYRLQEIRVYAQNQLVRKYQLQYTSSPTSVRSLLQSVTQYGSDGATALNPVTFQYSASSTGFQDCVKLFDGLYTLGYMLQDITNDGKADFLTDKRKADPSSDIIARVNRGDHFDEGGWGYRNSAYNSKFTNFYLADVNGDYFPDVIYLDTSNRVHVLLHMNGEGFYADTIMATLSRSPDFPIQVGDVNGDGRADLVYETKITDTQGEFRVLLGRTDGGFEPEQVWGTRTSAYLQDRVGAYANLLDYLKFKLVDLNGDGMADIVYDGDGGFMNNPPFSYDIGDVHVLLSTGSAFSADTKWLTRQSNYGDISYPSFQFGDVNGDGLPDLIYIGNGLRVAINTGAAFVTDTLWGALPPDIGFGANGLLIADLNGDGLADVAIPDQAVNFDDQGNWPDTSIFVWLSNGSQFSNYAAWGTWPPVWAASRAGLGLPSLADVNGDGLPDLVYIANVSPGNLFETRMLAGKGPQPDLLSRVDNGIGGSYTIGYTPSTAYANTYLPYTVQTVSSITANDGNGNVSTTSYSYSGGWHSTTAREFRGFRDVKQTLPNGSLVETWYYQDDIFKGLAYETGVRNSSGATYRDQNFTYQDRPSGALAHFPALVQTVDDNYDGTQSAQRIQTLIDYDAYGNVTTKYSLGIVDAAGDERYDYIDYDYDTINWLMSRQHQVITRAAANGVDLSKTTFVYEPGSNRVQSKTFWLDRKRPGDTDPTINYFYDSFGNVTSQSDPNGNPTTTEYEPTQTFPSQITNAAGHIGTITYDYKFSQPSSKTDPNGNPTSYHYDVFGRLSSIVGPGDSVTCPTRVYSYNGFGTVGQQNITAYALKQTGVSSYYAAASYFDGFGRTIASRSDGPNGRTIAVDSKYNRDGRVEWKSLPYFLGDTPQRVYSTYDFLGRLTDQANPDGSHLTMGYSKNLNTYFDPKGNKRFELRDAYGRLIQVTEFRDANTSYNTNYAYDTLGNLIKVTSAIGKETKIFYDSLSRKVAMSDPSMGWWHYVYDANGNLRTQIDAKWVAVNFAYDELNRPTRKEYPGGQGDPKEIVYTYDEATSSNAVGRLTTVTDLSGTTGFSYDVNGRTTEVEKTIDNVAYTTQYAYDAMGRVTGTLYPDGEEVDYAYDAAGNLSAVAGYVAFSDYNALGQPRQIAYQNGVVTGRNYNAANNRLTGFTTASPGGEVLFGLGYTYDPNGNITGITDDVQPNNDQTFTYDGLNRLISATSPSYPNQTITMTYDAIGNLMQNFDSGKAANRTGQARAYDEDNRLTGVDAGSTSTFVYDYQGARVKKISGASETIYVGKHFQITDGVPTKHIFAGGMRIATKDASSIYYYHTDHLGSLRVATDGTGARVQTVNYYPFGEIRDNLGSVDLPFKFTGQEYDPETGLYYYGARFYDPALGRFITPDSIVQAPADPQSLNRYAYCRNNPLIYSDPTGHIFGIDDVIFWTAVGIGFGFGAFTSAVLSRGDLGASLMGGLLGGLSSGIFMGVSGALANSLNSVVAGAIAGAAAGGTTGLISAAYSGGNIGKAMLKGAGFGALSGAVSGAISGSLQKEAQAADYQSSMRDMDKGTNPIRAQAEDLAGYFNVDEQAVAHTIYGEAGGLPDSDKLGVGWTIRNRMDLCSGCSYEDITAPPQFAPRDSLRAANAQELQVWSKSFQAAREVLNANPGANPIPGVTYFHDTRISAPSFLQGATQVPYGSGKLIYYKGPWP